MKRRPLTPQEHPKGSGKYRARTRINGKRKTVISNVSFAECLEAIAAFVQLRDTSEIRDGVTIDSFGKGFLDRRERRGVRGVSKERSRWKLMVGKDPIGSLTLATADTTDFVDWLDRWAPKGVQTRRNALNLLRSCFDEAIKRGIRKDNPAREVSVEKSGRAREFDDLGGVLFPAEQAALLAAVPAGLDHELVAFALYGGLRQGSQWALRREDCHGDHVALRRHKSGRVRRLRLLPPAREALERSLALAAKLGSAFAFPAPRGDGRHEGKVPNRWRAYLKAAGITRRVRWHDLRHTCATSLLAGWWGEPRRKWSLDEVCSYMHHSSTKVTERYARFLEETLLAAVDETQFAAPTPAPLPLIDLPEVAEFIERRGSDSNRRVTVLQGSENPSLFAFEGDTSAPSRGRTVELPAREALALAAEALRLSPRADDAPRVYWFTAVRKGRRDHG